MFEKLRDTRAKTKAQLNGQLTGPVAHPTAAHHTAEEPRAGESPAVEMAAGERSAREGATQTQEALTLSTMCACGHTRRDHHGLRIEVTGPCLECDCEEFARADETPESRERMMDRIRAGLEQVERLQEIVAGLPTKVNGEVLNRQQWLALRHDFCGEELVHSINVQVGDGGGVNLDFAGAELPSAAQLRIRHCRRATIVSIQRVGLYVGVKEAMLVVALGDDPIERWEVLWRGKLDPAARA
jgi:hypothetical protein